MTYRAEDAAASSVLECRDALSVYVEALFHEAPALSNVTEKIASTPVTTEVVPEPSVAVAEACLPELTVPEFVPPVWAQTAFKALLFRVGDIRLAAPLVCLSGIVNGARGLTPLPGRCAWLLGLLPHHGKHVRVIDLRPFLTARTTPTVRLTAAEVRHVILINGAAWGFACDELYNIHTLEPPGIRWRATRERWPWLAATVADHLCTVVDVDLLASRLQCEVTA